MVAFSRSSRPFYQHLHIASKRKRDAPMFATSFPIDILTPGHSCWMIALTTSSCFAVKSIGA
jgi:hypothetical protein